LHPIRIWFAVLGIVCVVAAGSAVRQSAAAEKAPAPGVVDSIVRGVQQRYDATNDFTADVTQEMTVASLDKTLTAHGTVAFQRPGKLRWQLNNGDGQLIVADGTTLWLYQPEEHQVLKTPFHSAFRASTPISFLLGVGRIVDDFDASLDSGQQQSEEPLTWLKLVPRQSDGTLGWLRLGVNARTFDIVAAEVHDQLGNVTRLQFSHFKRDVKLANNLFQFKVPDGVDVVEAPIGF
jgi:outer membrane lipoprotein carrier protein